MPIRTRQSLLDEALCTKEPDRSMLKHCADMVTAFSEDYLRSEMNQIEDRINSYKAVDKDFIEFNDTKKEVSSEVKNLKKRLKILKIILY